MSNTAPRFLREFGGDWISSGVIAVSDLTVRRSIHVVFLDLPKVEVQVHALRLRSGRLVVQESHAVRVKTQTFMTELRELEPNSLRSIRAMLKNAGAHLPFFKCERRG